MNFILKNEIPDILLDSSLIKVEETICISLSFLNIGLLTLKSTELLSVSGSNIYICVEKRNESILIDKKCLEQVRKLQLLFKDAINYESA